MIDIRDIESAMECVDIILVCVRNFQCYSQELGRIDIPIILNNGLGTLLHEWLGSVEYILSEGEQALRPADFKCIVDKADITKKVYALLNSTGISGIVDIFS